VIVKDDDFGFVWV